MADLQQYNIVGQYQQGYDRGRGQLADRLAGQAFSGQGADRQSALNQLAGVNPQAAIAMQGQFQQQEQTQQVDHAKKINGAANFMVQALQTKDPARIQGAYQTVRPYLAELGSSQGKVPPDQFDPAMAPMIYQLAGQSGGLPDPKTYNLSPGGKVVDASGQVVADNPTQPHDTGELATLRAMQQDPSLLATYQKAHPRAVASAGGGTGRAPAGYRFVQDGSLEAIPGGPADHSSAGDQGLSSDALTNAAWSDILTGNSGIRGYGKEAVAQRAQIANMKAKIAKDAGVSPQELSTTAGRNKALQSSLTNLQKQSDMMQKSEQAFQNNMDLAISLSDKVDRSGSPVVNKWLLGGRAAMGDPDVAALDAAITTAATDYARIMSGQSGAGGTPISTAEEAKKLIRKELSHKQFNAVADVLHQDIMGQQKAVDSQRQTILQGMQAFGQPQSQPSAPQQVGAGDFSHLWGN